MSLLSPALAGRFFTAESPGIPLKTQYVPNMVIDPGNRVMDQLYKVPVLLEFIFQKGRWIVKKYQTLLIQKNKTRLYQMD